MLVKFRPKTISPMVGVSHVHRKLKDRHMDSVPLPLRATNYKRLFKAGVVPVVARIGSATWALIRYGKA